jgi:regulatory associated protein of mTOR
MNTVNLFTNQEISKSKLFEMSSEFFLRPILKINKEEEYITQKVRHKRQKNKIIKKRAELYSNDIGKKKFESQIGFFQSNSEVVSSILFHSYQPLLITTDEIDTISIWNWYPMYKANVLNSFTPEKKSYNGRITDLKIINEELENSILCVSSSSGNIYFYKNYETKEELITSWKAATDTIPKKQGPGIITCWRQGIIKTNKDDGLLYVGGESETIKIWDLERELNIQQISTNANCITSLSSSNSKFNIAGTGDGTILLLDSRQENNIVRKYKEHQSWIVNAKIQKVNDFQIISGGKNNYKNRW